jgi:hypothetical protein
MTVLRTARGRASPVGRDQAVESRRRVSSTQAEVGRLSRRSVIPSIGDWLCGWGGEESVCLGWGSWGSARDDWVWTGPLVCPTVPDGLRAGSFVASAFKTRPPLTTWFQPGPSFSCSGEGLAEADLGVRRRHPCGRAPLARALPRPPLPPSTYCNHDSWQRGCPRSCSI